MCPVRSMRPRPSTGRTPGRNSSMSLSIIQLVMIAAWASGGTVVVFLASLQDVPRSLYEAATVDGANAWQKFFNVTVYYTAGHDRGLGQRRYGCVLPGFLAGCAPFAL